MPASFQDRLEAQLALALLSDCGCLEMLGKLETDARRTGMTGAEIDVALEGRSFEARTSAALAYACAIKAARVDLVADARNRAYVFGLSDEELEAVAQRTRQIIGSVAP
ncbi:MAG: hypothetical protein C0510_00255 [Erythrobacter sp.]|nr:hypothetical protein [Erythrobacter sp.]